MIAVTGAAGYIGSCLLAELVRTEPQCNLVAIDARPLSRPYRNLSAHQIDLTQPLGTLLGDLRVSSVVHLAFNLRSGRTQGERAAIRRNNLLSMENLLKGSLVAGVKSFIYLSSHTVYGAYRDNPVPITEGHLPRPLKGFPYSETKALCEEMAQRFAAENPGTCLTVLRCCMVMGPSQGNPVARALLKPLLIGVLGYDPPLQFVHERDLARLLATLAVRPCAGTFNVAGEGVIPYSRMARLAHRRLVFLPPAIAYSLVQVAWGLGIQKEAPAVGLDLIRYPLVLSTDKLKQTTGFRFAYTSEEALNSYLNPRPCCLSLNKGF